MKKLFRLLAIVLLTISCTKKVNFNEEEARKSLNNGAILLDVRTDAEYKQLHVKNSTLIPISQLSSRLNELDPKKEIIVYCAVGGRSKKAVQILKANNFKNVKDIKSVNNWPIKQDYMREK